MTRKSPLLIIITVGIGGCQSAPKLPYPEWAKPEQPYRASKLSDNAFDGYVLAAELAQGSAPNELNKVTFPSGTNPKLLAKLVPSLRMLASSQRYPCKFEYAATDAFAPENNAAAWRLMGRGLTWKIQSAIQTGNFTSAIQDSLVATRFGFDLMQGDTQTATLGIAIINDARKTIAPYYRQFSSKDLASLYAGLSKILTKFEGRKLAIEHEQKRIMLGLQFVQDAKEKGDFKGLQTKFGRDAKQAISYLKELPDDKRPAYFDAISQESKRYIAHWTENIDKPMAERAEWLEDQNSKTWKKLMRPFWGTIPPFATMSDYAICQTKILAISAYALANTKASGMAPKSLKTVNPKVVIDPFTGKSLIYSSSGPEFKIYSVGKDLVDDGGESDESELEPDIGLETNPM